MYQQIDMQADLSVELWDAHSYWVMMHTEDGLLESNLMAYLKVAVQLMPCVSAWIWICGCAFEYRGRSGKITFFEIFLNQIFFMYSNGGFSVRDAGQSPGPREKL
jgi:hypothetical protein